MPEAPGPRFLVAESNRLMAELLRDALGEGFPQCDVAVTADGEEAWRSVRTDSRDLAILDVHLAGKSGEWVLRQIRGTARSLPVIMTAAHPTAELEATLLHLGADDVLPKPFPMRVLIERVRARLRRVPPQHRTHTQVGDMTLRHDEHVLQVRGKAVALARKEHALLAILAERPGHVVPKPELMQRVWGRDDPDHRVLWTALNGLRSKLMPWGSGGTTPDR